MIGKNGITNGEDLNFVAKRLFGRKYIGVFPIQSTADVPYLNEGEMAILNRDMHWFSAFRKCGKLFESDSYGIDQLGRGYIDKSVERSFIQPITATDCGQRALINTYFALKG